MMLLGICCWVVLGLLSGFVASKVITGHSQGLTLDIVFGVVGALIGGWFFLHIGTTWLRGVYLWSLPAAVVGAVVLLVIWHAVRGNVPRA
jgi:uncharacterized membrane protein YeaQ/YmgE (transglycosylase-associated protein family)